MNNRSDLWEKELWTQKEVAQYFRVSDNTIKNWRMRGLFSFFRAPGSNRIFYLADEIKDFRKNNLTQKKKNDTTKKQIELKKEMPVKSPDRIWRVE